MESCHGKFWIVPHRRLHQDLLQASATELIDCTLDEHARYARAAMLGMSDEEMHAQIKPQDVFKPLTPEQMKEQLRRCLSIGIQKELGYGTGTGSAFAKKFLEGMIFLTTPDKHSRVDPRVYVIRELGWIRIRLNKFYAWKWDAITTERLIACHEYWKQQQPKPDTWLDFFELKTGREFGKRYADALKTVPRIIPLAYAEV